MKNIMNSPVCLSTISQQFSFLFFCVIFLLQSNNSTAQLPVWPLVTGALQSGPTNNTVTTTPHQFVDWTFPAPSSTPIPSTSSNTAAPSQAGINGCNQLAFFTLHNGSFPAASAELNIYSPSGVQFPLAGGEMNASVGEDEIQVVPRPGNANQWFVIYNLAPISYPNHPGYQSCYMAYSLIEIINSTASYVLDGSNTPIKDRILGVNGTNYQYFNGKATSRTSVVAGGNHDIYAQRRTQGFGSSSISSTFQLDRFTITTSDVISWSGSSSIVNGYSWNLMAGGSPIEMSPTENSIAVMARTQNNNQNQIYLFNPANLTAPPNTITLSNLFVEFLTPPATLTGTLHQASSFDNLFGTGFDWLRNFERKISSIEYSPNGQYLYLSGGGYNSSGTQNVSYLGQIDLNSSNGPNQDHTVRLQVQAPNNLPNPVWSSTTGTGLTWSSSNLTNAYNRKNIGRLQSALNGNLYFCKANSDSLWVIPTPDLPMPISMTPSQVNLSTTTAPNIPTNGAVALPPDQIDGFNYAGQTTILPTVQLGPDTTVCANQPVLLAPGVNNALYLWQDGSVDSTFLANTPGTYWVQIIINGCVAYDSIVISNIPFSTSLGQDTVLCQGQTLTLSPTSGNVVSWQDATSTSNFNVSAAGQYWVVADSAGCLASDTVDVSFTSIPTIQLGADTTICSDQTFNLTYTGTDITQVLWSDGTSNLSISTNTQSQYWVQGSNICGLASDTINVTLINPPIVDLGNDTTLCVGSSLNIDATTQNATDYLWQDGSTSASLNVQNPGVYSVVVSNLYCSATDNITISQINASTLDLGEDQLICEGISMILSVQDFFLLDPINWNTGDSNPYITITEPGTYSVNVSNICGNFSDSVTIEFENCDCLLYVPNTFTPDSDEFNNEFGAVHECTLEEFEMIIYNRWGQQIFVSYDSKTYWDGTFNQKTVPDGVYTYIIKYSVDHVHTKVLTGHVNILK